MSRVLIVDDEPSIREFLRVGLSYAGYTVTTAADGPEALMVPEAFEVLLTDLMMPRMRGDELARQMRQREPDLKVLYLTAFSDRLFETKTNLWEGEAFLDKPATVQAIVGAIEMLLNEDVIRSA